MVFLSPLRTYTDARNSVAQKRNLLSEYITQKNTDKIREIYKQNPKLFQTYGSKQSLPIYEAIQVDSLDVFKTILDCCPSAIKRENSLKENLLHVSIVSKGFTITKWLLDNHPTTNCPHRTGATPLHLISQGDFSQNQLQINEIVTQLLAIQPHYLSCRDNFQRTPLHWSVIKTKYDLANRFMDISKEAATMEDQEQKTPFDYCEIIQKEGVNVPNQKTFNKLINKLRRIHSSG